MAAMASHAGSCRCSSCCCSCCCLNARQRAPVLHHSQAHLQHTGQVCAGGAHSHQKVHAQAEAPQPAAAQALPHARPGAPVEARPHPELHRGCEHCQGHVPRPQAWHTKGKAPACSDGRVGPGQHHGEHKDWQGEGGREQAGAQVGAGLLGAAGAGVRQVGSSRGRAPQGAAVGQGLRGGVHLCSIPSSCARIQQAPELAGAGVIGHQAGRAGSRGGGAAAAAAAAA